MLEDIILEDLIEALSTDIIDYNTLICIMLICYEFNF